MSVSARLTGRSWVTGFGDRVSVSGEAHVLLVVSQASGTKRSNGSCLATLWKYTPGFGVSVCAQGHMLTTEDCGTDGGQEVGEAGNDRDALVRG